MPWSVVEDHPDCGDGQYAVVNDDSGEVEGCHTTMDAAEAQQAALYANEPDANSRTGGSGTGTAPGASRGGSRGRPATLTTPVRTLRDLVVVRGLSTAVSIAERPAEATAGEQRTRPAGAESVESFDPEPSPVMAIRFSVFDTWYRVDSFFEGTFLERTQRGAFAKTIAERANKVKVLFNHGMDFSIGDKVLGVPELLEERDDSPYAEVPLLDTSYNADLLPGLRAGAYGSSFTFQVMRDEWNDHPERSDHNPDRLPERTITEVRLMEFGPVTWPANPDATAGIRCLTDDYYEHLRRRDPRRVEALTRMIQDLRTSAADAALRGTSTADAANPTDAPGGSTAVHPSGLSPHVRARVLALPFLSREQTHEPDRAALRR